MPREDYRTRNAKMGLCTECPKPSYPPGKLCLYHKRKFVERQQKYYRKNVSKYKKYYAQLKKKWKDTRRCTSCGTELDDDIDNNMLSCQNCRERIRYEQWK